MSGKSARRKSVLIVEDEAAAREASERYLVFAGYEVATAASAAEALVKAESLDPDVVVCDWQLGKGPHGPEVARQLQMRRDVPIIFVTAHPIEELRDVARDISVFRYIRKPVQLSVLAEVIDESTD